MLLPVLAHAKPPASEADRQKAVEYFKAGNQAFAEGDSLQAYTEYTEAWRLHESFDIACNLGRTEAELGKSRDAAEHLDFCLANFSASARPEIRSAEGKLREVFGEVRTKVSSLTLRVEPDGAVVRVDGSMVGKTPLRRTLYLDPGAHEVDVRMVSYAPLRRIVNATRGDHQELLLELTPDNGAAGPSAADTPAAPQAVPPAEAAPERPHEDAGVPTRTVALVTAGGLSVVALGVGGAYWFHSRRLDGDARQARRVADEALGPGGCRRDSSAGECVRLDRALEDRDSARTMATVGLAAGGILAAGALAGYLWWPSPSSADSAHGPAPRAAWVPVVDREHVGLVVWGAL